MKCIVCGTTKWKYLFPARDRMFAIAGKFNEYQCVSCGLVRLHPIPRNLKKYYPPTHYYSYGISLKQSFFGWLRAFLITHKLFGFVPALPKGKLGRILDLGCGTGDTLVLLKKIGWDVYGMDIDAEAIHIANERGLINVSQGTDKNIQKYRNNFFNVIRLYHVIEHIDDPMEFFLLAYDKLKPRGELILGTPNSASLIAKLAKQYWYNLDCPRHLYIFSPETLIQLTQRAGFADPVIEYVSAGGWVGSVQYLLRELTRKPMDLVNRPWLIMLIYPFEWILDRLGMGDVFVLRVKKP